MKMALVVIAENMFFLIFFIGYRLFFQNLGGEAVWRLSFQRFFGLPRLRTPCGRLSLAIFARRLSPHSFHMAVPLAPSNVGPLGYVLDST
jgi:hypothetical protein